MDRYDDEDEPQGGAWRRTVRRASTGVVFLGLAVLVRGTFGIVGADAEEKVVMPEWAEIETPVWDERLAPGQRLPPPRPAGLLLKARFDVPAKADGGARPIDRLRYVGPREECV